MKICHSVKPYRKRKHVSLDDSWVDSFDPMPNRLRTTINEEDKAEFARKLRDIDSNSGILDFLPKCPHSPGVKKKQTLFKLNSLSIETRAKIFARKNGHLIRKKMKKACDTFINTLKCTKEEQLFISAATKGQSTIYTRQKTKDRNPSADITKTVANFLEAKNNFMYSNAMKYGADKEKEALYLYQRLCSKKHEKVVIEEPGLLVDPKNLWMGVSLDGIRQCECCGSRTLEIKCPFTCKDMDPKSAFFSPAIGGKTDDSGRKVLNKSHLYYFQINGYGYKWNG